MNLDNYRVLDKSRKLVTISGKDAKKFLQGILTNDIEKAIFSLMYSGILTPQGKYLFDFFVWGLDEETFRIDIDQERVEDLISTLNRYRLRSEVFISDENQCVLLGFGQQPSSSFMDPRSPDLGWRKLVSPDYEVEKNLCLEAFHVAYEMKRIAGLIPKYGYELIPNESYILEVGFDRLNAVSFSKGCFVGQEVTARMKHKTNLKNGLIKVSNAPDCSNQRKEIYNEKGQMAGTLSSSIGGMGLGLIKFLYAQGRLCCEGNELQLLD